MGTIMWHDPRSERIVKTEGETTYLRYVRPNDKTVWLTRCRVEGSGVNWASKPGGRWRTDPRDEAVTYEVDSTGKQLTITEHYSDGSANVKSFKKGQL
jgi:hypothetical protein